MKMLLTTLAAMLLLGLTACETEPCYACTHPNFCDIDICEGTVTTASGCSGGSGTVTVGNGATNDEYKEAYETAGYTCSER